ncbi:DUF4326 domain-containing protein [Nitrosovibrio sp. Nv6]|uniref:DUF4326 domain-containing protein n=1 Tax=Nitrosovibrio sp. Nv6 TaxID=1855340 RepID=UPI0008AB9E75|nr:DUF4326 domain-containing protein [Nitrosovibrio sp. Nv6]SEO79298.1 protein of unknown function [Nitrosovibrio sp. Nv6]
MTTTVVHCKKSKYDVYIGRPSKWGNPFTMSEYGSRSSVVQAYREWVVTQPHLMNSLHELKGKTIACWCAPLPCHGDVLAELAEESMIQWPGGECPVSPEALIEIKTRDGTVRQWVASDLTWTHDQHNVNYGDIVAYREL